MKYRETTKYKETQQKYYETARGKEYLKKKRKRSRLIRLEREQAGSVTAYEWRTIIWAYRRLCAYCGIHEKDTPEKKLTMDHIEPLSKGGVHHRDNVVPACAACNQQKLDMIWLPNEPKGKIKF